MNIAGIAAVLSAYAADPTPPGTNMSVWEFAVKGGPTMIVIALCSLVALAVIVERLLITRRSAVAPGALLPALKAADADPLKAMELCKADDSPLARILSPAIRYRNEPTESMKKSVADSGRREVVRLKQRMRLLGALPQVSTMLGLLGTILGMIKTFQAIATSGQSLGKTELLARGIFEAWANTAAGLLVAIPVLIAYHALLGRIDARAAELDRMASDWIEEHSAASVARTEARSASSAAHVNGAPAALAAT